MPYVQVNGHEIHYHVDDHTDPGAVPETVFMQHFIFGSGQQFHRWVPTLSRNYRVIRMDRWGNGLSSAPPKGHEFTLEGVLSDFDAFLDAMYLDQVHYVGVSLGGVLGAAYAATRPERVKSLVLTSTPCWIKPPTQNSWAREGYPDGAASVHALGPETWALLGWIRGMSPDASPARIMTAQKLAQQTGSDAAPHDCSIAENGQPTELRHHPDAGGHQGAHSAPVSGQQRQYFHRRAVYDAPTPSRTASRSSSRTLLTTSPTTSPIVAPRLRWSS